jgi:hypothetical protein
MGVDVDHERASTGLGAQMYAEEHDRSRSEQVTPGVVIYSIASGLVAIVVGAAVSLLTPTSQRLIWWAGSACAVAVAAGILYESRFINDSRLVCPRWVRRLVKPLISS